MNAARLKLLVTAKKFGEAEKLADSMLNQALKRNDTFGLRSVFSALSSERATIQPELVALGVRAAMAGIEIDGETSAALIRVVKAYSAAGNMAKVKECAPKAVDAAEKELTDDTDPMGILRVAAAHFAVGDAAKAKEFAENALSKVDAKNAGMKRYVEEQAKQYGVELMELKDPDEKK